MSLPQLSDGGQAARQAGDIMGQAGRQAGDIMGRQAGELMGLKKCCLTQQKKNTSHPKQIFTINIYNS